MKQKKLSKHTRKIQVLYFHYLRAFVQILTNFYLNLQANNIISIKVVSIISKENYTTFAQVIADSICTSEKAINSSQQQLHSYLQIIQVNISSHRIGLSVQTLGT
jgi:hypothetical protein